MESPHPRGGGTPRGRAGRGGGPGRGADHQALRARLDELAAAQADVERLYARWAELEAKARA